MDNDLDMSGILSRGVECPSCGARQEQKAAKCAACGASLEGIDEEESVSVMSEAPRVAGGPIDKTPLERSKNFLLIRNSATGIQDGTMGEDEYRQNVAKLRIMAETALKLYDTDVMKKKFADATGEEQKLNQDLKASFERLSQGVARMEAWLKTRNLEDVKEGAAQAEAAFVAMDQIQDRAAMLPGASEG